MSMFIGICLMIGLGYYLYVKGYKNGLVKNGHVCSTAPIMQGVRYNPQTMKLVNLPCRECDEVIPSEFQVITDARAKSVTFSPRLDLTDFELHMKIHHDKVDK
jgi:hypothetical protein